MQIPPEGENNILWNAHFYALLDDKDALLADWPSIVDPYRVGNGFAFEDEGWSHDNHTALVVLSKLAGKPIPSSFKDGWFPQRAQPWNIIWWENFRGSKWTFVLMWVVSMSMIWTCLRMGKAGNGRTHTSGKMLTWLRLQVHKMPITEKICNSIIEKLWGDWAGVVSYYFQDHENHPVTELAMLRYRYASEEVDMDDHDL